MTANLGYQLLLAANAIPTISFVSAFRNFHTSKRRLNIRGRGNFDNRHTLAAAGTPPEASFVDPFNVFPPKGETRSGTGRTKIYGTTDTQNQTQQITVSYVTCLASATTADFLAIPLPLIDNDTTTVLKTPTASYTLATPQLHSTLSRESGTITFCAVRCQGARALRPLGM